MDSNNKNATRARPILLLLLGALASSFIAPISRLSDGIHPVSLLCFASIVALLGHYAYFGKKMPLHLFKNTRAIAIAFGGGAILTWSYVLFAWSIRETSNEIIPTLTFELYPVGVILFSNLLLFRESVSPAKLGWLALSVLGVVLVIGGSTDADSGWNWSSHLGPALMAAVLAVTMLALGMTLVSKSASEMKEHADAPIFASLVARIGGVVTTLPIAVLGLSGFTVTLENFLYIMFYGVVILTLSNFAYYKAVAMAETHLINAVWYVTPVLSIIWLTLLGFGYINEWVGVGAAFVIVANIMLHLAAARRHSFRFTISWILIVGTILAVTPGLTHTDHYFDPIAALLVFFALLHGFAASRLDTCVTTERKLAVEIVRSREISQLPKEKLLALREAVADLPKATSERGYDHLNAILDDANIKGRTLQKIEEIVLSRAQRLAVGELFVLLIIGGTIVLLSIMTRPSGWIYNAFALIATTGVAFTLLTLVDQLADRARPIFELRDSADQKKKIVISPSLLSTESLAERALVASLAISLIAVYLAIFFFFE